MRVVLVVLALIMWAAAFLVAFRVGSDMSFLIAAIFFGSGTITLALVSVIEAVIEVRNRMPSTRP